MKITVLTLFPNLVEHYFSSGMLGRARERGFFEINCVDLRDYAEGKNKKSLDDTPYGGGPGMLLKPEPIFRAFDDLKNASSFFISVFMTPQGKTLSTKSLQGFLKEKHIVLLCGHYEGVDQRVRDHLIDFEVSIGDYVLMGGELPAMVFSEALLRGVPQILGNENSHQNDSFSDGLLEYPQYTRPSAFRGHKVPSVLLSGHHKRINAWRKKQSIQKTFLNRPDMLKFRSLSPEEKKDLSGEGYCEDSL